MAPWHSRWPRETSACRIKCSTGTKTQMGRAWHATRRTHPWAAVMTSAGTWARGDMPPPVMGAGLPRPTSWVSAATTVSPHPRPKPCPPPTTAPAACHTTPCKMLKAARPAPTWCLLFLDIHVAPLPRAVTPPSSSSLLPWAGRRERAGGPTRLSGSVGPRAPAPKGNLPRGRWGWDAAEACPRRPGRRRLLPPGLPPPHPLLPVGAHSSH